MMKLHVLAGLISLFLYSCSSPQLDPLSRENDSLRNEIRLRNDLLYSLASDPWHQGDSTKTSETGQSSPCIDVQLLRQRILSSQDSTLAFHMMVMALQDEASLKDEEINTVNSAFMATQKNYRGNLAAMNNDLKKREQELAILYHQVEELKRMQVAEIYYLQAKHLEEKAALMKFARKKRKENLREALELYQKSFTLGKKEAMSSINGLKKILG